MIEFTNAHFFKIGGKEYQHSIINGKNWISRALWFSISLLDNFDVGLSRLRNYPGMNLNDSQPVTPNTGIKGGASKSFFNRSCSLSEVLRGSAPNATMFQGWALIKSCTN